MKKVVATGCTLALLAGFGFVMAQEGMPPMPKPEPEHKWLDQFAGEWECDIEMTMDPSKPATKSKGTESMARFGDFWMVFDVKAEMMGMPFKGHGQIGYDPAKKKYCMTWIDTMGPNVIVSWGSVDATGKALVMEYDMDCDGKMTSMKDTSTIVDKDTRTMTSQMKTPDGKWFQHMSIKYKRKK